MEDVFELQDDITQNIVDRLKLQLAGGSPEPARKRHTHNVEAYNLYLKGRYHLNLRTEPDLRKAVDCFGKAVAEAPGYALPHAGLAEAYILLSLDCPGAFCEEDASKAREAVRRAIELDESSAEAHVAAALLHYRLEWNWNKAEHEFRAAIRLQEDLATAHHQYGMFLASMNRLDEAIAEVKRAHQLDPLSPIISTAVGRILHFAGQFDEAVDQFHKTLEVNPGFFGAYSDLSLTYIVQGKLPEAKAVFDKVRGSTRPQYRSMEAAWVHAMNGRSAEAFAVLTELRQSMTEAELPRVQIAFIYAALADVDSALELLEDGYRLRDSSLVYLLCEPGFGPLRDEPRFRDLARKMGLDRFAA
jgi:Tfp pilus assembly protein PilF